MATYTAKSRNKWDPKVSTNKTTAMISKDSIETAYCFFHQKERVYAHSTMDWQKDDIEYAISSYVDDMDKELYDLLSGGNSDFLRCHATFHQDIKTAMEKLEQMIWQGIILTLHPQTVLFLTFTTPTTHLLQVRSGHLAPVV